MVTVPYVVVLDAKSQTYSLKTMEAGPFRQDEYLQHLPRIVPIVTQFPDGTSDDGFFIFNSFDEAAAAFSYARATVVYFDAAAGKYEIATSPASFGPGLTTSNDRNFERKPPGWRVRVASDSRIGILYRRDEVPVQRGDFELVYTLPADPLPNNISRTDLERVVDSVKARFNYFVGGNRGGVVTIRLLLEAPSGGGMAKTEAERTVRAVNVIHNGFAFQSAEDSDADADAVDANFPADPISVTWNAVDTRQVSNIESVRSIEPQLNLTQSPNPGQHATIRINPNTAFDYSMKDGIDADKIDLEYVLTHETIHALGYQSLVDDGQTSRTNISMLDLFRFSHRQSVSAIAFNSGGRLLVNNDSDISHTAVLGLVFGDAAHTHEMALGIAAGADGRPGDHWLQSGLFGSQIGIMEPTIDPGQTAGVADYVFESDWRALDAIGWALDFPMQQRLRATPQKQGPTNGQQGVSRTPTLAWTDGTQGGVGDYSEVYVYRGAVSASAKVVAATGITSTSYAVPAGKLRPSRTYSWLVNSVNSNGNSPSKVWTFSTASGCASDWDANGTVEPADIALFVAGWTSDLSGGVTFATDYDENGAIEPADIAAFVQDWTSALGGGCY